MKLFFALVALVLTSSAEDLQPMKFDEVFGVIRTNLSDISDEELGRLAARGLIQELGTKVQLVTNNASAPRVSDEVVSRKAVYSDTYAYLQIKTVDERLPEEFTKWFSQLKTNSTRGLVLDLRYAQGDGYAAAAQVADQFARGGEPLMKVGTNQIQSTDKTKVIDLPVAALVNKETRGAAEALAALVRETGAGLVIGSTTAGEARLFETFKLSTGQELKIGTVPVEIRGKKLPSKGLTPDLALTVSPSAEKIFYQDPFRSVSPITGQVLTSTNEIASASTNRARRFNEAELVRRHRTGASLDDPNLPLGPAEGPDHAVINDPVLARALDFLKGISALQQHRPL